MPSTSLDRAIGDQRYRFLDSRKASSVAPLLEVDHRRSGQVLAFDACTGELDGEPGTTLLEATLA